MNFFSRSGQSKLQATIILHTIIFTKNKPHHKNQREKLYYICENQPNRRTLGNTSLLRLWFLLTFTLNHQNSYSSSSLDIFVNKTLLILIRALKRHHQNSCSGSNLAIFINENLLILIKVLKRPIAYFHILSEF